MVSDEVGAGDIAEVVGAWTGIPVGRLLQGESEKLLHMEERIGERLIGQAQAVKAVSDCNRPIERTIPSLMVWTASSRVWASKCQRGQLAMERIRGSKAAKKRVHARALLARNSPIS